VYEHSLLSLQGPCGLPAQTENRYSDVLSFRTSPTRPQALYG
jgi:hypothetical protein